MSSIDLVILGMVLERPQSAYELQKDVEYHHLSRWTKISVPSVYRKVIQLQEDGCLHSELVPGDKLAPKTVYSITDRGRAYFESLMDAYAAGSVPLLFDFNVVITNLSKLEETKALSCVALLRESMVRSADASREYAAAYPNIPLAGKAIFEQQRRLYRVLLEWLDDFEAQLRESWRP